MTRRGHRRLGSPERARDVAAILRALRAPAHAALLLTLLVAAPARAQSRSHIERYEALAECGGVGSFAAELDRLGASPGDATLTVTITRSWAGLVRGELTLSRPGARVVERVIEDDLCADVEDALAIAAALALRSPPEPEPAPEPLAAAPSPETEPEPAPATDVETAPTRGRTQLSVGAGLRVGLGPVPGIGAAPALVLGIRLDRLTLGMHLLYWPEAAAPEGQRTGVALAAFTSSIEIGVRLGDDVAVIPAAVVEVGAAVARGLGVESSRTEAVPLFDAGMSATFVVSFGALGLFARADVLVPVARPSYVVEGRAVFEAPFVRGTGMLGISGIFELGPPP